MNLAEILFKNKNLYELNLGDNEINHDGIIAVTSVLNWNNQTLGILNLDKPYYESIGQETAIHFAKMLQSNRSIEKLSIQKHNFTCEAIYTITEHLLENNKLLILDLSANKISFKGCEALA
jgi:Ran GTPase-activating protein (RanGAP) involved in mRNA processing and transport